MLRVLCWILRVYEDVVQVSNAEHVQVVTQYSIDVALERCGSVGQPKWHDPVLKVSVSGLERRLPFVSLLDPNQVIRRPDVKLGVDLSANEAVQGLADQRQGIVVLDCELVEAPVVYA